MKKGDIIEAVVTGYDFPNKGSFVKEDRKFVVKGAFPGQKISCMITKKKSGKAEARIVEVLEKSTLEDEQPFCEYFGDCGGCTYQTMSYPNQLAVKEKMVRKLIDKALGVGERIDATEKKYLDDYWEGIVGSPVHQEYRNKMEFTFGDAYKDGPLALGLHKKGSFYDILEVGKCRIVKPEWGMLLEYTLNFFRKMGTPYYHRMRHEGILRNLVVRQSASTGEFLINLVAADQWTDFGYKRFASIRPEYDLSELGNYENIQVENTVLSELANEFVDGILELSDRDDFNGAIAGILYTENNTLGDVVQSDRTYCIYGRDYITEKLACGRINKHCVGEETDITKVEELSYDSVYLAEGFEGAVEELSFKISPFSFFQTNTRGCEILYAKAREYILNDFCDSGQKVSYQGKVVFDLYSGTGTIAQMMAKVSGKVIGIEIVEEAVEAARENAKLNGLTNCEFIAGDVLNAIDLVEDKPDMIILDPPRDGINPRALQKILAFGVDQMVYISCKPTSLARDLEAITTAGYIVVKCCCIDQFPNVGHVESIVALQRTH